MSEQLTRKIKIESIDAADNGASGLLATLSSEYAVARHYGNEILSHDVSAVDLSRAPLPLVISHNTDELNIGVVDQIKVVGRKLKGLIRLGTTARAKELLEDIKAGVITNLSIGYQIIDSHMEGDNLIATKWQPYECSLVSVGADPYAGIGRSFKSPQTYIGDKSMNEETNDSGSEEAGKLSRSQRRIERAGAEKERSRIAGITALSETFTERLKTKPSALSSIKQDSERWIENGYSVDDFKVRMRDTWLMHGDFDENGVDISGITPSVFSGSGSGYSGREYSIAKLIQHKVNPGSVDAGYELEVSQEWQHRTGRRGNQLLVPLGRSMQGERSMTVGTATAGGHLVETNLYSDRFIDALLPQSTVLNLGITTMSDLQGNVAVPRADANPAVSAYNLDDTDTISATDPTLSQITLTPRSLAGVTVMSHKMITQGSSDTEGMIRNMLSASIAAELDRQLIQGDGTGSNITGVVNTTGIGAITYANGGSPNWANVVNLESELAVDNVAATNLAYLVHPTMAATLKTTEVATNTGRFIMQDGMMNGYPVRVTTNIPAGTILLGAWNELILGTWGVLALDIDPYSDFRKGNVQVRAILDYDAAVRHPQAFAVSTEAEA